MEIGELIGKVFLLGFEDTVLSWRYALLVLTAAGLLGAYIFFVYRLVTADTFYSRNFNAALVMMCLITAAVIVAVRSNVVVSLGMVGALSIVRFRTAVKEPLDLIFMFWSISAGIICGAGLMGLALILTLMATGAVVVFCRFPELRRSRILVVNALGSSCAEAVFSAVKKYDRHYSVKSRTVTEGSADFLMEIRLRDQEGLLRELSGIEGVVSVSLIDGGSGSVY